MDTGIHAPMTRLTRSIAACAALLLGACGLPSDPEPRFHEELPEDRGTMVGTTNLQYDAPFAWGLNGDELYHGATSAPGPGPAYSLKAVTIAGLASRDLVTSTRSFYQIAGASDGSAAFYALHPAYNPGTVSGPSLHRVGVAGGAAEDIALDAGWGLSNVSATGQRAFVEVANGDLAYLQSRTTLAVKPRSGDSREVSANCHSLLAVSPAREQVLCVSSSGTHPSLTKVTLATGAAEDLAVSVDVVRYLELAQWDAAGIRLYHRHQFPDYRELNVATGASRLVLADSLGNLSAGMAFGTMSISPDGSTMAHWRWECLRSTGIFSCDTQYKLVLTRLADLSRRHVAVVKVMTGSTGWEPSRPLFSPDGSRLAYHAFGRMYVVDAAP